MTIPLDPAEWLLNYDPAVHDGHRVTPLIDGASYFAELILELNALGPDDFFYSAGWAVDADVWLDGNVTFRTCLDTAAANHAKVRFLLYKGMLDDNFDNWYYGEQPLPSHLTFVNTMDLIGHEAIIDLRHPQPEGSHHSKYVIVGKKDAASGEYVLTGYVGGIDIVGGRWAAPEHDSTYTWHDVQCKVEGPIVFELLQHFENRWAQHPTAPIWVDGLPLKTPTTPAQASSYPIRQTSVGSVAVQHLFTYPCHPNNLASGRTQLDYEADAYYAFVPRGMRTIEEAIINAIRHARVYIYLENYAFYHQGIAAEIAARLDARPELQVIYLGDYRVHHIYQPKTQQAYATVRAATNGANFQTYDLRTLTGPYNPVDLEYRDENYKTPLYVHSKLVIVDDCWATIGSANFNHRSMTTDGEVNVGFVDLDLNNPIDLETDIRISAGVRAFRQQLWAEHLQLDPTDSRLEGMLTALATWRDLAQDVPYSPSVDPNASRARVFKQDPALRNWTYWSEAASYPPIWGYIDPTTRHP